MTPLLLSAVFLPKGEFVNRRRVPLGSRVVARFHGYFLMDKESNELNLSRSDPQLPREHGD